SPTASSTSPTRRTCLRSRTARASWARPTAPPTAPAPPSPSAAPRIDAGSGSIGSVVVWGAMPTAFRGHVAPELVNLFRYGSSPRRDLVILTHGRTGGTGGGPLGNHARL